MTEFSDLVSMIDNLKVEIHGRFRHLLNSIAALEARLCDLEEMQEKIIKTIEADALRLCKVEAALGIENKPWVLLENDPEEIRLKRDSEIGMT